MKRLVTITQLLLLATPLLPARADDLAATPSVPSRVKPAGALFPGRMVGGASRGLPPAASSEALQRSSFPGRRVGGGTRGDCSARLVIHLVPPTSLYAPGDGLTLAVLEGPAPQPRPLQLLFRPTNQEPSTSLNLPAQTAGLTLVAIPRFSAPMVWESGYQCGATLGEGQDLWAQLGLMSPPAQSLLLTQAGPEDQKVQQALRQLSRLCGRTVPFSQLVREFDLAGLESADWPAQLPVRCRF